MEPQFFNIINDELRGSETTQRVTDPRTEEELWPCPVATTQDFEDAVAAARRAFTTWGQTTVAERQALLVKLADVVKENGEELASILMKETGKSVSHNNFGAFGEYTNTLLQKILADIDIQASIAQLLHFCQPPLPSLLPPPTTN